MSFRGRSDQIIPKVCSGHLYYIRLRTHLGPLYKIGFTSRASVEDRFSGDGALAHDEQIEKVLLFVQHDRAYWLERELHGVMASDRLFSTHSQISYLPLCRNGQSELYAKDVLQLDDEFREEQERNVRQRLRQRIDAEHANSPHRLSGTVAVFLGEMIVQLVVWVVMRPLLLLFRPWVVRRREKHRVLREHEKKRHQSRVNQVVMQIREIQTRAAEGRPADPGLTRARL